MWRHQELRNGSVMHGVCCFQWRRILSLDHRSCHSYWILEVIFFKVHIMETLHVPLRMYNWSPSYFDYLSFCTLHTNTNHSHPQPTCRSPALFLQIGSSTTTSKCQWPSPNLLFIYTSYSHSTKLVLGFVLFSFPPDPQSWKSWIPWAKPCSTPALSTLHCAL